jgi:HEAT repeats/HEAT repeat
MTSASNEQSYISGVSSHKWEERLEAIRMLEVAGPQAGIKARNLLQSAIKDEEKSVRVAAVEALGNLGEYAPVVTLLEALDDPYWDVRAAAAQALGKLGTRVPIEHLVRVLQQEQDESVRAALIRTFGRQGKRMPVDLLKAALHDDDNWLVREAAAWALGELGEQAPIGSLIQALQSDDDESVRAAAAKALGRSGKRDSESSLYQTLLDKDEQVREAAAWALQQLDEETRSKQRNEPEESLEADMFTSCFDESSSSLGDPSSWNQKQKAQFLSVLADFIKEKRGFVRHRMLSTEDGQILLLYCCYERTDYALHKAMRGAPHGTNVVLPFETIFNERDAVVHSVLAEAVNTYDARPWQELLILSFALMQVDDGASREHVPLRVVVSGIGYPQVRKSDSTVLDQIVTTWLEAVEEPLAFKRPQDLVDIKVWYQPIENNPTLVVR